MFQQQLSITGVLYLLGETQENPKPYIMIDRHFLVNKKDFLQVFQDSGIGKMEENLTSAEPQSIPGRPGKLW